jgi:hypothetical protein
MRTMGLMVLWKYDVRSFLQKYVIILYFSFFMESFVIIKIPSVVILKKNLQHENGENGVARRADSPTTYYSEMSRT